LLSRESFATTATKQFLIFATATDGEIVKHIEAMKGEMFCGRFEENQLGRWLEKSNIKTRNPRLYKFLISFMLLGAGQSSNAQIVPAQEKVVTQRRLDSLSNFENTKAERGVMICDTINKMDAETGSEVRIRVGGVTSISTRSEPLFIVDGIQIKNVAISKLDPKKIKEITILKPTSGQALYGLQGANGVIYITSTYTPKQLRKMQ